MAACPSCAAPLDSEGICTTCGALARGFFRGLDLGAPQIADAVARGLDFYQLLGIAPNADTRALARRYRQLRALFPDDPAHLKPEPARRLALLEVAGRTLTDPRLRHIYDELRASQGAELTTEVLRCSSCAAPLGAQQARCSFCGTPRPPAPTAPSAPPSDPGPPATEPVDYYAMLGLTPEHLMPSAPPSLSPLANPGVPPAALLVGAVMRATDAAWGNGRLSRRWGPPPPEAIDEAALEQERHLLLNTSFTRDECAARLADIEVGRRILRSDRWREQYDALLLRFRSGGFDGRQVNALRQLQDAIRAEIAEEHGDALPAEDAAALLRQGLGYLSAGLPREALSVLGRALGVLSQSAEGHAAYAQAILRSEDALALGGHLLREALRSLEVLTALGAADAHTPALILLCKGLLARDQGDLAQAEALLQQAVQRDSRLAAAWRGLAALALARGQFAEALGHAQRAVAIDPRDERALMMIAAASLRRGQRSEAREAAAQIAALRGAGWTAQAVLGELGG